MPSGRLPACLLALLLGAGAWPAAGLELTPDEAAGKALYLRGESRDGTTPMARVGAAATLLPASATPCANCHGRDGRGRAEGGLRPPEIRWRELTKPYGHRHDNGREHPPFDAVSFARAVAEGVDPAGQRLDPAMPRYVLSMADMARLTAYLQRIEDDHDPGIANDSLRVGSLLPVDGPLADYARVVRAVLEGLIERANAAGGVHGRRLELVLRDPGGDPATARRALEALAADGVFALVAPLAPALEGELAAFADRRGIPVIGPLGRDADGSARYLFNPLAGLREQLFALGDFAGTGLGLADPVTRIVAPSSEPEQSLAGALAERLASRGWRQVAALATPPGGFEARAVVGELVRSGAQAVFFLGRESDFAELLRASREAMLGPIFLAPASQAAEAALQAPPGFTERIFLAYPSLPGDWSPAGREGLVELRRSRAIDGRHGALQVGAWSAMQLLLEGLRRSGRDLSRERLADTLEKLYAFDTGLTPPLSFGPGRRIGAAGAHIVTVDLQTRRFRPTGAFLRVDEAPR